MFLATLLTGYVAAGSPRLAYAGFQAAFTFFLCILQGGGPGFDLVSRAIGSSASCWET